MDKLISGEGELHLTRQEIYRFSFPGITISNYCDKTFRRNTGSTFWNKISVAYHLDADEVLVCCANPRECFAWRI